MATAAEYRQWAEECFKWARNASDEDVRQSYLKIDQLWLEHAARTEGVAGTITPQEPEDNEQIVELWPAFVTNCYLTHLRASEQTAPVFGGLGQSFVSNWSASMSRRSYFWHQAQVWLRPRCRGSSASRR
jgi:hypothetical protein